MMALSDDEVPKDAEEIEDIAEFNSAFPTCYSAVKTALSLNKAYVLHVAAGTSQKSGGDFIAASFSNRQVAIYNSPETLTTLNTLQKAHDKAITGLAFSRQNQNHLFTSSLDQTVKLWDLRQPGSNSSAALTFTNQSSKADGQNATGPPGNANRPVISFDVSPDNKVLCAGTEQVGDESFLLFWDTRSAQLMGGYWESHEDDITSVKFHPEEASCLATGSTDGQVNVFNLKETEESDALTSCHNTDDSVAALRWYRRKTNHNYLAITTHTEGVQLWDTDHFTTYQTFSRGDVAHAMRRRVAEHAYIVGMHPGAAGNTGVTGGSDDEDQQGFTLLVGSRCVSNPCLRLVTMKNKKLKPAAQLNSGKIGIGGIVRCSEFFSAAAGEPAQNGFVTGSEDGTVTVWQAGSGNDDIQNGGSSTHQLKIKSTGTKKPAPY